MSEVQELRCKTCDAVLDLKSAVDGVIECAFCHNVYTIPKEEARSDTRELLQIAEHDLDTCAFDRAYTAYSKVAQTDEGEPEAYFGMALSSFKVQYLKDAAKKHLQPICHDVNDKKFTDDKNYKKALSLATAAQKKVYTTRAEEIDAVAAEFNRLKNEGLDYDCFICVKVSDGNANTQDSYDALKLYNHLKKRGYSPFYSEEEIRGKAGAEYEARILYALYMSECMLVVCSNEEYLQTPWVKNEYTRFMELIGDEQKDSDSITIVFKGKPIERLPGKRALIQGVNLNNPDAYAVLETFVENHTPEAKKRREEAAKRKEEDERKLLEKIEEQKRIQKEFEEQLRLMRTQTPAKDGSAGGATVQSLLKRAKQELSFDNTDEAEDYYRKVLDMDPENAEAWWGMFLLDYEVENEEDISDGIDAKGLKELLSNKNYKCACDYASGELKKRISAFDSTVKNPSYWWSLFLKDMNAKTDAEVLGSLTSAKIGSIPKNENFVLAVTYSDPAMEKRIVDFKKGLTSPEAYWQLFLEDFKVKNENSLLSRIDSKTKKAIEQNTNYLKALRRQDSASDTYKRRISNFYDALNSVETDWKLFLEKHHAGDEKSLIGAINGNNVDTILSDPEYREISGKASGALKEKILDFEHTLRSFDFWWNKFLKELSNASDERDYFANRFNAADFDKVMSGKNISYALKYADERRREQVEIFRSKFSERKAKSEEAQMYWKRMLDSYGCKFVTDLGMYNKPITEDENYQKALALAEEAGDRTLIYDYTSMAQIQEREIEKRKKESQAQKKENKKKAKVVALTVIGIAVPCLILTSLILAFCGVQPFWTFWTVWTSQTTPGYGFLAFPFVLCFFALALTLVMFHPDASSRLKNVMRLVSIGVCFVFVATGVGFYAAAAAGASKVYIGDGYVLTFATNEDGTYALETYLDRREAVDVVIPDEHNGKTVTGTVSRVDYVAVGDSYYALPEINSLELGAHMTEIPDGGLYKLSKTNTLILNNSNHENLSEKFGYWSGGSFWSSATFYGGLKNLETLVIKGGESIGASAFSGCSALTSVTIADTVKTIDDNAFQNCTALTGIVIPDSVTSIGNNAFDGCKGIASIIIPDSVVTIGENAFRGVPLEGLTLGNKVSVIGAQAFYNNTTLTSVNIPASVSHIGDRAFSGCSALTSITIPDSVTSIGENAFYYCTSLESVKIGKGIETIASNAFGGCPITTAEVPAAAIPALPKSNLATAVITDGAELGAGAFRNCTTLTSVTFPDTLKTIDNNAFYGCKGLTEVTVPTGVTTIGSSAFRECTSLESITIPNTVTTLSDHAIWGCTSLKNAVIPDSVTEIGDYAFSTCGGLESVKIGGKVTRIGVSAFHSCALLTTVEIPDSVVTVDRNAFYNCSGLTEVKIGKSVNTLDNYAFYGCTALSDVTVPDSVTKIGEYVFQNCTALSRVKIGKGVESIASNSFSGCVNITHAEMTTSAISAIPKNKLATVVITGGTAIGNSAFSNASVLESVTIPDTVTSIGESAFAYCKSLVGIDIPETVLSIKDYAFRGCTSFTEIIVPANVEEICGYAFADCSKVTKVTIEPGALNSIAAYAFTGCTAIESVDIPSWAPASFPFDNLKTAVLNCGAAIKNSAFSSAAKLESVTIPDTVTSIGASAFNGCRNLMNVNIPSAVTSIGEKAFYNCTSLLEIIVPAKVKNLGDNAFYGCPVTVYCEIGEEPSSWGGNWNVESRPIVWDCKNSDKSVGGYCYAVIDGIRYSLKDGNAVVVRQASSLSGDLTIPKSVKYKNSVYTVSEIGSSSFSGCTLLTGVTVPDSVTVIGNSAFYGCTALINVALPDTVTSSNLGQSAFYGCNSIVGITAPSWMFSAFSKSNLTSAVVTSGDSLPASMFSGCTRLASVTLPESITSIGANAFYNCSSLEALTLPEAVTSIGSSAFYGCSALSRVNIPAGVTAIADSTFYGCKMLSSITLPESVTNMGSSVFYNCSALVSIKIPSGVTAVGSSDFYGCTSLASVTLPAGVTSIGYQAFYGCTALERITLPSGVDTIGDAAFRGCTALSEMVIPSGVTKINNSTFYGCSALTSITLPAGITNIYGYAFNGCGMLKTIVFAGTTEQWTAISKSSGWNSGTGNYSIRCSNGNISK